MEEELDQAPERRRCDRRPVERAVGFRRSRYSRYTALLHDLSASGCRIEAAERLAANDRVWVVLPGIEPLVAKVLWTREWIVGARFESGLHPAVFDMVRQRLERAAA